MSRRAHLAITALREYSADVRPGSAATLPDGTTLEVFLDDPHHVRMANPDEGQDRDPGLASGRSRSTPARAVIPAAAIERRTGGGSGGAGGGGGGGGGGRGGGGGGGGGG